MEPESESLLTRALRRLSHAVFHNPRLFFYPQLLLAAAAAYYTYTHLGFQTSRNDLVGSDKKYHRNFLVFKNEFGGQDDLVAVVESEDREKNRQFVERLGLRLQTETNLFKEVVFKGDLNMLGEKALFFLSETELPELRETLKDFKPFLETFSTVTNLNGLFRMVNKEFRSATEAQTEGAEQFIKALPSLERILGQAHQALIRPGVPPAPGVTALFGATPEAEQAQYNTFDHGRIYLVTARAAREDLNGLAVERLREMVDQTRREVPGINAAITGEPVLEYDEMLQSQRDSTLATIVSLALVAAIFIYGYRETGRPLKATFALIIGLTYTMGYTTLAVGHLNILTVTFLPILIGLAIDFGVHLITRYEEEIRHSRTEFASLEKAMVNTGLGIFTGCLTTAAAFFAMAITDFKGIQEMGVITGGGMLVCLIPMMTFLPAMLLRGRQNVLDHQPHLEGRRARIEKLWLERPWVVLFITAIVSAVAIGGARRAYFDYNLLNMQSKGLPAVRFEEKLIEAASAPEKGKESTKSVLFGAVVAASLEDAARLEQKLTSLPSVAGVESAVQFLRGNQEVKRKAIEEIRLLAQTIEFAPPDTAPADPEALRDTLFYTRSYLGLAIEIVKKENEPELLESLTRLRQVISDFRGSLQQTDPAVAQLKLTAFQQALFNDVRHTFETLKRQKTDAPLTLQTLPPFLKNRFVGRTGKLLLMVYPKKNVWSREEQEEFVRELRTVDPEVTGTPVQLFEYTTLLRKSYETAAWYALAAVAIMILIHFHSIINLILALLPVVLGTLWLVGFMGWFNVPFNPANIMTLPLVIGIGVTNGVHILNRFAEEQNPSILAKSTGKAVLISGLTTVAGFGSLIPAQHQGISSLGIVMSVGVGACMVAALTFLPTVLNLLIRAGWRIKKPSGDNALSTLGREEPR